MFELVELFFGFCIFCIILFVYLQVQICYKVSNHLEIINLPLCPSTNAQLEDVVKQQIPTLFPITLFNNNLPLSIPTLYMNYGMFDVNINGLTQTLSNAITKNMFSGFSRYNTTFLKETGLWHNFFQTSDELFRPFSNCNCMYDIIFSIPACDNQGHPMQGLPPVILPTSYETYSRNFFYVSQGSITIRLAPPKTSSLLCEVRNYSDFTFQSNINLFDIDMQTSKIKYLEFIVHANQCIYIPPYWWYSISMNTTEPNLLCTFQYNTYMNHIALLHRYAMYFLQHQNVRQITNAIKMHTTQLPVLTTVPTTVLTAVPTTSQMPTENANIA